MPYTPKFEQIINNGADTLNGGINDSVTSLDVNDASSFPSDGNFRILIGSEILLVTAVSTNTFTVVRGAEGSTAAVHSNSDPVTQVVTAGGLQQMVKDYAPFYGLKPICNSMTDISGNPITSADFSWVNQGTSSVVDLDHGGVQLTVTEHTSVDIKALVKSAPSTPYTITAGFSNPCPGVNSLTVDFPWIGLAFRESATSKISVITLSPPHSMLINNYDDETDTVTTTSLYEEHWAANMQEFWFQIHDDGSDLYFRWSPNGVWFQDLFDQGRSAFFTTAPDQVGIFVHGRYESSLGSGTNFKQTCFHWSEA